MVFLTEMVIEQMKNAQNAKQGQNKVVIIQSLNNLQIMLPELGYVNALRAYLEFNKIDYQIDERSNAEWMSPDGQLPLIKYGRQLVSGFLPIIEFINKQFEIKVNDISTERQAILDLFNKVIIDAELYYTWLDKDTFEKYTKFSYAYGKPWPLNNILCWLKRRDIAWVCFLYSPLNLIWINHVFFTGLANTRRYKSTKFIGRIFTRNKSHYIDSDG